MNSLREVKEDLKNTIVDLEEVCERLRETEECGVDKYSGHYGQTSKYSDLLIFEAQLQTFKDVLEMLKKVKRVK